MPTCLPVGKFQISNEMECVLAGRRIIVSIAVLAQNHGKDQEVISC